jgi:ectoine hydroxylase-related dioxygenase (phytanoyl-CoA dioxygenase family)
VTEPLSSDRSRWLEAVLESLKYVGYAVVEGVLDRAFLDETRAAMYQVRDHILRDIGKERLTRAGELTILRLMMRYEPFFYRFLEIPAMLEVVDATVSPTAILHLQNGFILPSFSRGQAPRVYQNAYHQDFPRVLGSYLASINVMFAIDEFSADNGGTLFVPGTHQRPTRPDDAYLTSRSVPVECGPGAMLIFDSTIYHAAGSNESGKDRLAINHQFTRSFIKQQIDYVRGVGDETVLRQPPRTQQLLGWYTRVVTSLDEYYQPEEQRLYRRGQG